MYLGVNDRMGVHPKIGITGLPRSGKSAVMEKVVRMLQEERGAELRSMGQGDKVSCILGGMRMEPFFEDGRRVGFKCVDFRTGQEELIAHRDIDSRIRVLGYGIDPEALERVAVPAIRSGMDECEVIVIDEIGKFTVESEGFVAVVREALAIDKPTILTLHKKSRHPLLQDIRRRDDARILEVTPVNRALLPYKIHKLIRQTF